MPLAHLGDGKARRVRHHMTGPGKLLSRELLQQFVCSYTQMSYRHTKGGNSGLAHSESCSVRCYHQDRLTLEVKASAATCNRNSAQTHGELRVCSPWIYREICIQLCRWSLFISVKVVYCHDNWILFVQQHFMSSYWTTEQRMTWWRGWCWQWLK